MPETIDKVELTMTFEEARRLRSILVTEVTWRTSAHGKAAEAIHRALVSLPYGLPLSPEPLT